MARRSALGQRLRTSREEQASGRFASDEEVEAEVQGWLMRRPGDFLGTPSRRLL